MLATDSRENPENDDAGEEKKEGSSSSRKWQCHRCSRSMSTKSNLSRHLAANKCVKKKKEAKTKEKKAPKPTRIEGGFPCRVCGRALNSASNLNAHMRTHTGYKPFVCDVCSRAFMHRNSLKAHMVAHSGIKAHQCDQCGKRFGLKQSMRVHMRTAHMPSSTKKEECDLCGKLFASAPLLKSHMLSHVPKGDRAYKCGTCAATFRHPSSLRIHKKVHLAHNPHKCRVCGYVSPDVRLHRKHEEKHASGRQFNCDICNLWYRSTESMLKHSKREDILILYRSTESMLKHYISHIIDRCPFCETSNLDPRQFRGGVSKPFPVRKKLFEKHCAEHLSMVPFVCYICGLPRYSHESILQHYASHQATSSSSRLFADFPFLEECGAKSAPPKTSIDLVRPPPPCSEPPPLPGALPPPLPPPVPSTVVPIYVSVAVRKRIADVTLGATSSKAKIGDSSSCASKSSPSVSGLHRLSNAALGSQSQHAKARGACSNVVSQTSGSHDALQSLKDVSDIANSRAVSPPPPPAPPLPPAYLHDALSSSAPGMKAQVPPMTTFALSQPTAGVPGMPFALPALPPLVPLSGLPPPPPPSHPPPAAAAGSSSMSQSSTSRVGALQSPSALSLPSSSDPSATARVPPPVSTTDLQFSSSPNGHALTSMLHQDSSQAATAMNFMSTSSTSPSSLLPLNAPLLPENYPVFGTDLNTLSSQHSAPTSMSIGVGGVAGLGTLSQLPNVPIMPVPASYHAGISPCPSALATPGTAESQSSASIGAEV